MNVPSSHLVEQREKYVGKWENMGWFYHRKVSRHDPCDVLPMDACHLFLGRPWQYYRYAIHHGKENKYSFKKNAVTYKIHSLIEEDAI